VALEWAAQYRGQNNWIIWLCQLVGYWIGYHYYGKEAVKATIYYWKNTKSTKNDSFKNGLVLIGTIITHLFGGSAGREGTAVQMGGQ
jgi:H+/Cl- antiporter ClcA